MGIAWLDLRGLGGGASIWAVLGGLCVFTTEGWHQVAQGAQHISFCDPDFFNGIRHAMELVEAFHAEFPGITYDVTIKIEHLRKQEKHLARLRDTGCLFVISAVESVDDGILERLDKGHTRED